MKFTQILPVISVALTAGSVAAICPGFNYGIGNVRPLGNGVNRCDYLFPSHFVWDFETNMHFQ